MQPTLSIDDVIWRVASLASRSFQERYVVNGTADEYILDDDLINDVDALKFRIHRPENAGIFSDSQRQAIEHLLTEIGKTEPNSDDFLEDSGWNHLRESAIEALVPFGIERSQLTVEFVNGLHD